jgi:hypothetical protein
MQVETSWGEFWEKEGLMGADADDVLNDTSDTEKVPPRSHRARPHVHFCCYQPGMITHERTPQVLSCGHVMETRGKLSEARSRGEAPRWPSHTHSRRAAVLGGVLGTS